MLDVSLIKDLPPFEGIDEDALQTLINQASARHYKKDTSIFAQDAEADAFFILLDGYVRVVKLTPDGEQFIARYIPSGELFGIAPAIGQIVYPANAVAAVDCVALSWPTPLWQSVVEKHPGFATNIYGTVGKRLAETRELMIEMATAKVEIRVANAVAKLASQSGRQVKDGLLIDFPISRQDISDMTGTTLHTVSRLLSRWEEQGLVKCGRQKIVVSDIATLARLSN